MTTHAAFKPEEIVAAPAGPVSDAGFERLEWGIIQSARDDRLWTIRPAGRLRRFLNWMLNVTSFELANERLEALRKAAVLSWNYGYSIPGRDVDAFIAAGFSPAQYELMVNSIADARTPPARFA